MLFFIMLTIRSTLSMPVGGASDLLENKIRFYSFKLCAIKSLSSRQFAPFLIRRLKLSAFIKNRVNNRSPFASICNELHSGVSRKKAFFHRA